MDIVLIDGLLDKEQCEFFIEKIDKINPPNTKITRAPNLSKQLWIWIKDNEQIKKLNIVGIKEDITIGRTRSYSRIRLHKDKVISKDDKFKISIYLNDVGSGTIFCITAELRLVTVFQELTIKSKQGRGVFFDISLPHESEEIPIGATKYIIGARVIMPILIKETKNK